MKLKLDENLGRQGIQLCIAAGHDTATVLDQGLTSAPDPRVIEVCREEGRCLVTLDLDFSNPLIFDPHKYAGIAVLRLPKKACHEDLLDAVRTLLAGLALREIAGQLWIVDRGRIREYQPEN